MDSIGKLTDCHNSRLKPCKYDIPSRPRFKYRFRLEVPPLTSSPPEDEEESDEEEEEQEEEDEESQEDDQQE